MWSLEIAVSDGSDVVTYRMNEANKHVSHGAGYATKGEMLDFGGDVGLARIVEVQHAFGLRGRTRMYAIAGRVKDLVAAGDQLRGLGFEVAE